MKENEFLLDLQLGFVESLIARIENIEHEILNLEDQSSEERVQTIRFLLGEFHSIKGNSSAFQIKGIQTLCHKVEDFIIGQPENDIVNEIDNLLKYCDAISEYSRLFKIKKSVDDQDFFIKHNILFEEAQHKNNIEEIVVQQIEPRVEVRVEENSLVKVKEDVPGVVIAEAAIEEMDLDPDVDVKILAVGISFNLMNNLKKFISGYTLKVSFVNNSSDALQRSSMEKFDLVISSYVLDPIDGLTLCVALKKQWPENRIKFILFPCQEISPKLMKINNDLLPNKIIVKDKNMYNLFFEYCSDIFKLNNSVKKVLFLDDETSLLDLYQMVTEEKINGETLFLEPQVGYYDKIKKFLPDLIVSDINMPGVDVLDMMDQLRLDFGDKVKVIFLTGDTNSAVCQKLREKGALRILDKSTILGDLLGYLSKSGVKIIS